MTDSGPHPDVVNPPELHSGADDVDAALRIYATKVGLTSAHRAAELLNVTEATLLDLVAGGELAAVVVDGHAWVNPAALQLRVLQQGHLGAAVTRESRALARSALRGFLAARPVTGDWTVARGEGRPLVCRRRGKGWLSYGIEHHAVVLNTRWLGPWVVTEGTAAAPELAGMPVGPQLTALLADLPGVEAVASATPLLEEPPRAHNVSAGWVRVAPSAWPVVVPPEVAAAVGPPPPDGGDDA